MKRSNRQQTYDPAEVDDGIKAYARERGVGNRVVVGDCIHDAWLRETEADSRKAATAPVRQNVFTRVALAALLTYYPEHDLRERTVAAYHRRLVRFGLVAPRSEGGEHGE